MNRFKLKSKGITLISLIITIIILIILEGISINLILGENSLINKSKDAKNEYTVARLLEKLELLKGPIALDGKTVNIDNYLEKLNNNTEEFQIKYIDRVNENEAYAVVEEKYRFLISDKENGDVEIIYQGISSKLTLSETLGNYIYPESKVIKVIENESGGALSASSSDEEIATTSVNGNEIIVQSGTKEGKAIITVVSAATGEFGENKATYKAIVGVGTLQVTATPYSGTYDGSAHGITVTANPSDAKIEYSTDGISYNEVNPTYTDVGEYTTYYKVSKAGYKTVEGSLTVTLTKATGDLSLSSTSGTYTYPTSGTFTVTNNVSGGALSVSSSNNIATATISGNTVTISPGTTAGEATITVKSAATGNYEEKTATHTATVQNGTITVNATPYSGTYDGSAHGITVTANPSDAKIEYSTNGTTYSTTKPTYTNVGTYTTYYKVSKTGYKTVEGSLTVVLTKATGSLSLSATSGTYTYPTSGTFTITNNASGGTLSVSSSNNNIATASISGTTVTVKPGTTAGEATITVKSAATGNYEEKTATHTATVQNGTITVNASPYSGAYDGSSHGITVTATPSDAKIEYSSNGTSYSTTKPTYTNVGTYTTYYKVSKTGYKTVEGSLTVKITNAPNSVLKVGDYVKYTPTAKAYTVATTASGTSAVQSFNSNTYTGLWRVLYNDSKNGLQLISNTSVINLSINGKVGYNNIVGTLNSIAGNYVNTTYTDSARSVGSTTSSTQTTTGTTSIYSNSSYAFIASGAKDLKVADTNYTSDVNVLENKGMLNIGANYWLASRYIYINNNGAGFCGAAVGTFNDYTGLGSLLLKCIHSNGVGDDHEYTAGVRPVVKLKSTVKVKSGSGTSSSPWQLAV